MNSQLYYIATSNSSSYGSSPPPVIYDHRQMTYGSPVTYGSPMTYGSPVTYNQIEKRPAVRFEDFRRPDGCGEIKIRYGGEDLTIREIVGKHVFGPVLYSLSGAMSVLDEGSRFPPESFREDFDMDDIDVRRGVALWVLGCLVVEAITGGVFTDFDAGEIRRKTKVSLVDGKTVFSIERYIPADTPGDVKYLVRNLLRYNPKDRFVATSFLWN
jgi:hypothetical protein